MLDMQAIPIIIRSRLPTIEILIECIGMADYPLSQHMPMRAAPIKTAEQMRHSGRFKSKPP